MSQVSAYYDYLLIGHGIAGATLARDLQRRGRQVLVFDEPHPDAASRVAAGLMNPVAGKRFALTWRAADTLPFAAAYYQALDQALGTSFFQALPILKVFGSAQEAAQVQARAAAPDDPWGGFLERIAPSPLALPGLTAPHGGAWLRGGGYVQTEPLLARLAAAGRAAGWLREEAFDWWRLAADAEGAGYAGEGWRARHVVVCQGAAALSCPFFQWLPLTPNRGAVLDVTVPGLGRGQVLNRGAYVVPTPEAAPAAAGFRVGATYRWPPFTAPDDPADQRELTSRLADLTDLPFAVTGERRGTRPAVRDRRPLLGRHPTLPWLSLLGGFGSKGVSLAPRLAELLADHLETGAPLWPEADLARYYGLFSAGPK